MTLFFEVLLCSVPKLSIFFCYSEVLWPSFSRLRRVVDLGDPFAEEVTIQPNSFGLHWTGPAAELFCMSEGVLDMLGCDRSEGR